MRVTLTVTMHEWIEVEGSEIIYDLFELIVLCLYFCDHWTGPQNNITLFKFESFDPAGYLLQLNLLTLEKSTIMSRCDDLRLGYH